jgi:hypothetical protein
MPHWLIGLADGLFTAGLVTVVIAAALVLAFWRTQP